LAIKLSEKESLRKSFMLFFLVIELFLGFIFYHFAKIEEEHLQEKLFLEMKNYALFLDNDKFEIDIVPKPKDASLYELKMDKKSLYILTPLPNDPNDLLKIYYPKHNYLQQVHQLQNQIIWNFIFLSGIAVLIALLFSLYVLKPLRDALLLLETFIKDIIHDLNTPLSSILINLKMMDENNEEVESISQSAKTIAMLHHNLDAYLKEQVHTTERFLLSKVVEEQQRFFASLYEDIRWEVEVPPVTLYSDPTAFSRIVYNLLSNACKYNTSQGYIYIGYEEGLLIIENSSYHGIEAPHKVFNRFYKEHERGLGIGLHIVKKLAHELHIRIELEVEGEIVRFILDLSAIQQEVTLN